MVETVVNVAGADLAVTDRGAGETVVMLHSLGHGRHLYDGLVESFLGGYRTVSIDLRGHGDSGIGTAKPSMERLAEDLRAVLDQLGIAKAHFVGQSIGAMTILGAAAAGSLDGSLFLLDSVAASDGAWDSRYADRVARIRAGGMAAVAAGVAETSFSAHTLETMPEVMAAYTAQLSATSAAGYIWGCEAMTGFDFRPRLAGIKIPANFLTGMEDRVAVPAVVEETAAMVPGARFTAIPDSGHLPILEQPEHTGVLLTQWLAENKF